MDKVLSAIVSATQALKKRLVTLVTMIETMTKSLLSIAIALSFILVLFMSAFCIFSAFMNHKIAMKMVTHTVDETYYYLRENLKDTETVRVKEKGGDQGTTSNNAKEKRQLLLEQAAIDKLRSAADAAFDSNTVSFLFAVFRDFQSGFQKGKIGLLISGHFSGC